jgi:hypothetical protein
MKIRFSGRRTLTLTGKLACLGSAVSAANDHPRASNAYKSGPPMAAIAQPDGQKSLSRSRRALSRTFAPTRRDQRSHLGQARAGVKIQPPAEVDRLRVRGSGTLL